jgi:hypothetical protein
MNSAKFDGVQEGKSGGKGPLGLPCAVTPEGRDRQLQGQWVNAGAAVLNPVNAVVQWRF